MSAGFENFVKKVYSPEQVAERKVMEMELMKTADRENELVNER